MLAHVRMPRQKTSGQHKKLKNSKVITGEMISPSRRRTLRKHYDLDADTIKETAKASGISVTQLYAQMNETYVSPKERKEIQRELETTSASLRKQAKNEKVTLTDLYERLKREINDRKREPRVNVQWSWWLEKPNDIHPDAERDGHWVRGWNNHKYRVPRRFAINWDMGNIYKFVDFLQNDTENNELHYTIVHAIQSKSLKMIVVDIDDSEPNGQIPIPTHALNRDGSRRTPSNFLFYPVLDEPKKTIREQFVPKRYNLDGMCMMNSFMNEVIDKINANYKPNVRSGKPNKKQLDPLRFYEIVGKEYGSALSFEDCYPVFDFYGIMAKMYNVFGVLESEYIPAKLDENVFKKCSCVIIRHDGHAYQVDDADIKKSLVAKQRENIKDFSNQIPEIKVSQLVSKPMPREKSGTVYSIEELLEQVCSNDAKKQTYTFIPDLKSTVVQMITEDNYIPLVAMDSGIVSSATIKLGEKLITLVPRIIPTNDITGLYKNASEEDMRRFDEVYYETDKVLRNKSFKNGHKSQFSHKTAELLFSLKGAPPTGLLREFTGECVGLDQVKCFPYHLLKSQMLPVFCSMDEPERFVERQPIEPYCLYVLGEKGLAPEKSFHFSKRVKYSIVGEIEKENSGTQSSQHLVHALRYGFALRPEDEPIAFIRPYRLVKNTAINEQIIRVFRDESLPNFMKKDILNRIIGKMGTHINSRSQTHLMTDEVEAKRIKDCVPIDCHEPITRYFDKENGIWEITFKKSVEQIEGFQAIHKLIYDRVYKHLMDTTDLLKLKGIETLGYHGDSVLVRCEDAVKLDFPSSYPNGGNNPCDLGRIKKEKKMIEKWAVMKPIPFKSCELFVGIPRVHTIELEDEYDINEFKSKIGSIFSLQITSHIAGSGKTYMAYEAVKDLNYCIACFSNEQALEHRQDGKKAKTFHKLCGVKVNDEGELEGIKSVDDCDVIIWDELAMASVEGMCMIKKYMKKHPEKRYICTYDLHQNKPQQLEGYSAPEDYQQRCIDKMFPLRVHLKIPKRYDSDSKQKVMQLFEDLFETHLPMKQIIAKYTKRIEIGDLPNHLSDIENGTTKIISYTHETANQVNRMVHNKSDYFVAGEIYIATNARISKKIFTNFQYKLVKFNERDIVLKDVIGDETITVKRYSGTIDRLNTGNLVLPHCRTCHSRQGSSIDGKLIVFDTELASNMNERNWLYVALTRNRNMSEIYVCDISRPRMDKGEIARMIENYKKQDRKAERTWDEYITVEHVLYLSRKQKHRCYLTHGVMNISNIKGDRNNWSVDRIDNSKAHIIGNCVLSCVSANTGKIDVQLF